MLKDGWVDVEPPKNLIDFVNGFRHRLLVAGENGKGEIAGSAEQNEKYI